MLKSVKILRLALAALIAGILVLGTLVVLGSTASAATTRTLSISARPAAALVGKSVTFSGVLSRSPKGSKVSVQRKVGTSWVTAKTVGTSTAGGKYAARVTLPSKAGTYSYRALAAAGGAKAVVSATVKVSALTPVAATLRVVGKSPVTVTAGSAVTVTGTVKPFVTGTTVTIQRFGKSTWVSTGFTARVTSKGTYTRSVVVKDGSVFRVFVPRVGLKASAVSPVAANCVVIANPKISTTSLPDGNRNVAYSAQLTQVGANPGTWSVAPGLPAGLKLNSDTGRITGTPTGTSNASYTFRFAQPGLTTASKVLNLTVTVPVPPTIATTSLPTGQQGVAYTTTLTAQGNPAGTWTAAPLPAGLTRTGNTISGTPTTPGTTQVVIGFTQTSTGLAA
ncbi:MAG: putative Ig domain-containing protein, partial [Propionibacteriales bacterium]|nr:putative Ig domain-containing protein [Propionibacteriales bacterium]